MRALRTFGRFFKNFMIIFSFVVNLVLIIVVVALVVFIFDLKNNVVTPLVTGLHSSFVGLDESTIDWTIPVRDTIPVKFDLPLDQETVVTLTHSVPLSVAATITLPGVGQLNNAQVYLQLPAGLELPVQLDLTVPVDQMLDVALDVRAVIPLAKLSFTTRLTTSASSSSRLRARSTICPTISAKRSRWSATCLAGKPVDLLAENAYSRQSLAWLLAHGGLELRLANEPVPPQNRPVETGIVVTGRHSRARPTAAPRRLSGRWTGVGQ